MKICVTSSGPKLDSLVDPRFGRCAYFVFIDTKSKDKFEAVPNAGVNAVRGAGVQASQAVLDQGSEAVITGNMGPNSFSVLSASDVKVFQIEAGMEVKKAVEELENGNLSEISRSSGGFGPGRKGFGRRGR
jgi:predicted Fe-Mo cluster-binding NifX family protein